MSELLTRNRYQITAVVRKVGTDADGASFLFDIAGVASVWLFLPRQEFTALIEDLGMRLTGPEATEYESVPVYRREIFQRKSDEH